MRIFASVYDGDPGPALMQEVRQAYSEGLVDEDVADLEGSERDVAAARSIRDVVAIAFLLDRPAPELREFVVANENSQPTRILWPKLQ